MTSAFYTVNEYNYNSGVIYSASCFSKPHRSCMDNFHATFMVLFIIGILLHLDDKQNKFKRQNCFY